MWYGENINIHHYVLGFEVVSSQNPNGTDAQHSQQAAEV
jgi:hypothetical protein